MTKLGTTKYNNRYSKKNQLKTFKKKIKNFSKYIGSGTKYLERGHLTPHADFVMAYEQFGTYYYMNVIPQFKDVNNGNWLRIEKLTRQIAATLNDDLVVYTSYSFNIPAKFSNNKISVLLDENDQNSIIPERLYKVLYYPKRKSGIVFVVYNNPYKKHLDSIPNYCKEECNLANLKEFENLIDPTKGYVMCCKINYLKDNAIDLYREISNDGNLFQKILQIPTNKKEIA